MLYYMRYPHKTLCDSSINSKVDSTTLGMRANASKNPKIGLIYQSVNIYQKYGALKGGFITRQEHNALHITKMRPKIPSLFKNACSMFQWFLNSRPELKQVTLTLHQIK